MKLCPTHRLSLLLLLAGFTLASMTAYAQQPSTTPLPEAPAPAADKLTGTITGTVKDVTGAIVPGAKVRLVTPTSDDRATTANDTGVFHFDDLAPGPFSLLISEPGFEILTITGNMKPNEAHIVTDIAMRVGITQSVDAITSEQLAEIEIKQEEQQRVFAVVPNFLVSYNWHAQPLTSKQKFKLSFHAILDPTHFVFAAARAGIEQARDTYPGFDCNPPANGICWSAFGKRYGVSLADEATGTLLRGAIMPTIFHQDPRYFYKGTGTISSRATYAILSSVRQRGDNGHWQLSSGILAGFAAGALDNVYLAPSDRHGADVTFENGAINIAGVAVAHLLQEFVFKHVTPGLVHAKVKHAPQN